MAGNTACPSDIAQPAYAAGACDNPVARIAPLLGVQWSLRKLDVPSSVCGLDRLDRGDERRHDLFFNTLLSASLALEVGWRDESLGLHSLVANVGTDRPESMHTETVPVRLFAQWSGGWDALLEGLKVRQDVYDVATWHPADWRAEAPRSGWPVRGCSFRHPVIAGR